MSFTTEQVFQPPVNSSLPDPEIFLRVLFSDTLSLCPSVNVRDIFHSNIEYRKTVVFRVLIYILFRQKFLDRMIVSVP